MVDSTVSKSPTPVSPKPDLRPPDVILVCVCGGYRWFAVPDGFNSYVLECPQCQRRMDVSAGPGQVLTLKPDPAASDVERTIEDAERHR